LKLANTASNAGAQPTTTVAEAIMRLGTRTVRDLALAFSLVSERRRAGACRAFNFEEYWSKSLGRAVSAQVLSARTGTGVPQEAYICALLGEIGRLALAYVHPEQYGDLLESGQATTVQLLLENESELFRINHSEIANCLLNEWGLPDTFAEAVQNYATRERTENEVAEISNLTDILEHADTLACAFVAKDIPNADWIELGNRFEILSTALGMEHEDAARFYDGCLREWVSWGDDMDIPTNRKLRFSEIWENIENARKGVDEQSYAPATSTEIAAKAESQTTTADETPSEKVTVLAIDDEPLSLRLLTKHLKGAGYEVVTAADGKQGLKLALELNPDIVVADWQMPEMDGLELCKALRRTQAGQKMFFLLLTGMQEGDRLIEAFNAGLFPDNPPVEGLRRGT
jgi:CheY-like chemotaxis protein